MVCFKRTRRPAQPPDAQPDDGDPTVPRQLPPPPMAPPDGPVAFGVGDYGSDPAGVARVIGVTVIPQIVVGSPSPSVEPAVIGSGYRSLPFRPALILDGWSTESITMRGASQRGHLHRYNGAPRQDDFAAYHLPDGRVIVVVADVSPGLRNHIWVRAPRPNKPPNYSTITSVPTAPPRSTGSGCSRAPLGH
jgi:hypothetical protein